MTPFAEIIQKCPTWLAIEYQVMSDGKERFSWKLVGSMPILTLLGVILKVQRELLIGNFIDPINEPLLVIAQDEGGDFDWWVNGDIPTYALAGFLETVKDTIKSPQSMAKTQQQGISVLGPDGRPFMGT